MIFLIVRHFTEKRATFEMTAQPEKGGTSHFFNLAWQSWVLNAVLNKTIIKQLLLFSLWGSTTIVLYTTTLNGCFLNGDMHNVRVIYRGLLITV